MVEPITTEYLLPGLSIFFIFLFFPFTLQIESFINRWLYSNGLNITEFDSYALCAYGVYINEIQ